MHNRLHSLNIILCFLLLVLGFPTTILANQNTLYNEKTAYTTYIEDNADLLTESEEFDLYQIMEPIRAYGHVVFLSIEHNPNSSVEGYAEAYGSSYFGSESYILVVIDMDYREICVYSNGEIYKTITSAYARTITDNIYSYASDGEYYECAYHAFEQIDTLLEGRKIAQPMKYISNALLAITIALLINYFVVMKVSRSVKASNTELLSGIYTKVDVNNPNAEFLSQTKHYSPQQSSSSGARSVGRMGGGGFSGSGGGSRGGGGSHRF